MSKRNKRMNKSNTMRTMIEILSLEPEEEVSEQPTTQEHYGQFHEELQYPQMTHSYNNNFQMSGIDYGTNYNQNIEYDKKKKKT